jgi:TolB-like protein/class 3 adenylate cyclase/Tfp pilus assembly protein PilF
MSTDSEPHAQLEIGHVLFMDVVGYSKLLLDEQREIQEQLVQLVRDTEQVRAAEADGRMIRIPTGDGMALVFFNSPEAPARCAIDIAKKVKEDPKLKLRMGIHSGPVNEVRDVNDRTNVAGTGINTAQRVMDCGDAGHILVSKRAADDLVQSRQWRAYLHDLGEYTAKHGVPIHVVNLCVEDAGNPELPAKFKQNRLKKILASAWRVLDGTAATRTWMFVIVAVVIVATVAISFALFLHWQPARTGASALNSGPVSLAVVSEKSIAVLPFENRSDDKENAYFADGVQNEVLTDLAKIEDLKVISRTSVMQYRGGVPRNVREIGQQLGVAHLLEGSVQRSGNRVRVTAQLIDARSDTQQWAERYDRDLADVFGIQSEIAKAIADQLKAELSPQEKARVEQIPTQSTEAYAFYLRGNQIARNPDTLLADYKRAEQLYSEAIALDPNFALAHAQLASTRAQVFHYYEPTEEWKNKARSGAEIAVRLQPNLAEAHLALGQCVYWIDGDYARALEQFQVVLKLSPNNAEVRSLTAAITRRQGKWEEALELYKQAQKRDPQNPNIVRNLLFTAMAMRRWEEASDWADKFRAMAPASLVARFQSGYNDFWWKGDTRLLKSLVADVPSGTDPDGGVTSQRWEVAMIERDFTGARKILEASPLTEVSYTNAGATPKNFLIGLCLLAQGDKNGAQKFFEMARPTFEAQVQVAPESPERHANLGWCYAFMGRRTDAIREGERAVELKPESKDALDGALMSAYLALIYARVGENDRALALIERLLKIPGPVDSGNYSITVNDLKHRWEWDPLRNDPRFQALIGEKKP